MTSAGKQAASFKSKDHSDLPKPRQSYIGPILSDPDEPLSEDDFERFKMNVRFQIIIQFHQAAAHADIELAIAIYKGRMAQNGNKHEALLWSPTTRSAWPAADGERRGAEEYRES